MDELKVNIRLIMLWKFKNDKNATETAKTFSSVFKQGANIQCLVLI